MMRSSSGEVRQVGARSCTGDRRFPSSPSSQTASPAHSRDRRHANISMGQPLVIPVHDDWLLARGEMIKATRLNLYDRPNRLGILELEYVGV